MFRVDQVEASIAKGVDPVGYLDFSEPTKPQRRTMTLEQAGVIVAYMRNRPELRFIGTNDEGAELAHWVDKTPFIVPWAALNKTGEG